MVVASVMSSRFVLRAQAASPAPTLLVDHNWGRGRRGRLRSQRALAPEEEAAATPTTACAGDAEAGAAARSAGLLRTLPGRRQHHRIALGQPFKNLGVGTVGNADGDAA